MLRKHILLLILLFYLWSAAGLWPAARAQQSDGAWSEPVMLLSGPPTDNGTNPIVYTGPSNNTHLLYFGRPADEPDGPFSLYYARWQDGGWTSPRDVLVTPDNALPPTLTAIEDSQGYLHVIWNTNAIWSTRVHLQETGDLRSWQTPVMLYGDRLPLEVAAVIDSEDQIHLVISTRANTMEYLPVATDGSTGAPIQLNVITDKESFPYRISIIATSGGRLLTCWAVGGSAEGVWCSASDDKGDRWNAPERITGEYRGARLVYFPLTNQVGRVTWASGSIGGRHLQLSDDDGQTWSAPIDLTQGKAMTGYTGQVAAMDSARNVHALINPGDGRYVHVRTKNGNWLPGAPTGWQASDWIEMAVAQGNMLVVVYWVQGNKTYTSHAVLDAPYVPPRPVATQVNDMLQAPPATAVILAPTTSPPPLSPTATPPAPLPAASVASHRAPSQAESILWGVVPTMVLVASIVILQLRRRRAG